jgi:hypothetical protein
MSTALETGTQKSSSGLTTFANLLRDRDSATCKPKPLPISDCVASVKVEGTLESKKVAPYRCGTKNYTVSRYRSGSQF